MTRTLLSIDPGGVTGTSLWRVPDDGPIERMDFELVRAGFEGFAEWWRYDRHHSDIVVFEEFVQDGRTPRVDTNALEIQGLIKGTWDIYSYYLYPYRNSKKTTVGDRLLRQHGFWVTGSQVKWADGRDVNDSQLHALAWAKENHRPSLEYFWPKEVKIGREE